MKTDNYSEIPSVEKNDTLYLDEKALKKLVAILQPESLAKLLSKMEAQSQALKQQSASQEQKANEEKKKVDAIFR